MNNWKIEEPVYGDANGTTTYKQVGAEVEVWFCGFPGGTDGFRNTSEPKPQMVKRLTPEEAVAEIMSIETKISEAANARQETAAKAASYEEYVAGLPSNIAGFVRSGKELEDSHGNYVLTIPKKAASEGWSVSQIETYVNDQVSEGYGD